VVGDCAAYPEQEGARAGLQHLWTASLLLLLVLWALLLVVGFALFICAGSPFQDAMQLRGTGNLARFGTDLVCERDDTVYPRDWATCCREPWRRGL